MAVRSKWVAALLGLSALTGWENAFSQSEPRCLTDELRESLRASFPAGVEGRTLASDAKSDYAFSYVIPVVVHVMHDNGPEFGVTLQQALSQIEVLNEDFNRYGNGSNNHQDGAEVKISFCLASVDPDGNPHPGIETMAYEGAVDMDPYTEDTLMKRLNQWDPTRYLNIWTVRRIAGGDIRGYAYFPEDAAGTVWDGLVIDHRYFGRGSGTAISLGRTATHETGHYLGLMHPWGMVEDACFLEDDGCDDTPEVYNTHFAVGPLCIAPFACDGTTKRQIENYMDYSADVCLNMFTICQSAIMRGNVARYRAELVGLENLQSTGCSEVAASLPNEGGFFMYPNPASEELILFVGDAPAGGRVVFELFDLAGRRIAEGESEVAAQVPWTIDVRGYRPGMYVLKVSSGSDVWVRNLLISK